MTNNVNRRRFFKNSLLLSGGLTFDHAALLAKMRGLSAPAGDLAGGRPPAAKIGKLSVTR